MRDKVKNFRVIILAGGKGTRLAPYTTVIPKPLMPVGEMPILEIVIRQLKRFGLRRITMSVGHLSSLLQAYFGDGEKWGVSIEYCQEDQPLGTAGPLSLVPDLDEPFVLMNADLLTNLNIPELMTGHLESGALATLSCYERQVRTDLGILKTDNQNRVVDYIEKPIQKYPVSMGIYAFQPEVLKFIEPGSRIDLPDLIKVLLSRDLPVRAHNFKGFWLDIGRHEEYAFACENISRIQAAVLEGDPESLAGLVEKLGFLSM